MTGPGARKDPVIALILSLLFPGAGYLYAGRPAKAFVVSAIVFAIWCWGTRHSLPVALLVHGFFAIGAAGAAKEWNARNAAGAPPPPPLVQRGRILRPGVWQGAPADEPPAIEPSEPPPIEAVQPGAAVPPGPPLAPDEFLAELRAAWTEHRDGAVTGSEFTRRKRSAIERVRVHDWEDGVALLEATSALVGAGVMTPDERNRLKLKVGQS